MKRRIKRKPSQPRKTAMHIDVGKKTVALYARVSTMDQSCDMQLEDLRRYARRFARSHEYVEVGVSGAQRHRPQLDALMKNARKRQFDVVLVWKFDRFARSVKHLVDSLEEFRALGIDFISYTEGIDTTTPSGELLFHIMGAVAQFERDLIAERVRAGIAHARAMGKRIGRPRAVIDVDRVIGLRQQGHSLRHIAHVLDVPVSRVRRALAGSTGQLPAPTTNKPSDSPAR
jgi:DNA invertase Pin-like site-specific DNA recombinase